MQLASMPSSAISLCRMRAWPRLGRGDVPAGLTACPLLRWSSPASTPDILYIFTGLQNIDWIPKVDPEPSAAFDIIQPVLQYPGDGGDYWSVKSWCARARMHACMHGR